MCLQYKPFENTVGKGEIAPFPTVFSNHLENFLPFSSHMKLSSANSLNLEESKICRLRKGYNVAFGEKEFTFSQTTSILISIKFKAFADDKLNVAKVMISLCDRTENIVGKQENSG